MWAVVDGNRILTAHTRKQGAEQNSRGFPVEEIADNDPRLFVSRRPAPPADYAEARRREYAKIELGDHLELIGEALVALATGKPVSLETQRKAAALSAQISKIKAQHPKPQP